MDAGPNESTSACDDAAPGRPETAAEAPDTALPAAWSLSPANSVGSSSAVLLIPTSPSADSFLARRRGAPVGVGARRGGRARACLAAVRRALLETMALQSLAVLAVAAVIVATEASAPPSRVAPCVNLPAKELPRTCRVGHLRTLTERSSDGPHGRGLAAFRASGAVALAFLAACIPVFCARALAAGRPARALRATVLAGLATVVALAVTLGLPHGRAHDTAAGLFFLLAWVRRPARPGPGRRARAEPGGRAGADLPEAAARPATPPTPPPHRLLGLGRRERLCRAALPWLVAVDTLFLLGLGALFVAVWGVERIDLEPGLGPLEVSALSLHAACLWAGHGALPHAPPRAPRAPHSPPASAVLSEGEAEGEGEGAEAPRRRAPRRFSAWAACTSSPESKVTVLGDAPWPAALPAGTE
eukprot:tig00021179_g19243.t1